MHEYLVEAYHIMRVLVPVGTVWTGAKWSVKRWQKHQEDVVLSTFRNTDADGEWHSANGVRAELGLKAALKDAPGFFPPKKQTLKHWLRTMFYRTRFYLLHKPFIPSKTKADKILRRLWERGLLERAGWVHTDNEFYRLKKSVG